jgi:hypothetical protein
MPMMNHFLFLFFMSFGLVFTNQPLAEDVQLFSIEHRSHWTPSSNQSSPAFIWKENQLIISEGVRLNGLIFNPLNNMAWESFELELDVKKINGNDFLCGLTFPVGNIKRLVTLVLGGWGGSVNGISCIDGNDAFNNCTASNKDYLFNQWYHVKVQVTPTQITVWVDQECIIDFTHQDRHLSLRSSEIEFYQPFSITTYKTQSEFKNFIYRSHPLIKN